MHKFIPIINKPTRITEYSATLIDNMLINFSYNNINTAIIVSNISDHLPILISLELNAVKVINRNKISYRNITNTNINFFK